MRTTAFFYFLRPFGLFLSLLFLGHTTLFSQSETNGFDTTQWDLSRARIVEHLGRQAITGSAFLKDVVFTNGIVEVDIATDEKNRAYPGLLFRMQDPSNYERVYIRPHRSPNYDDALQYAPSFHGVDSWQLYSGTGKSASLEIPAGTWNHLKIVVSGDRADVYWNDDKAPAMQIEKLEHRVSAGSLGLSDPLSGSAYYSNFSFRVIDTLTLPAMIAHEPVCGIIGNWVISSPYPLVNVDFNTYPSDGFLSGLTWQTVTAGETGMVDVSRYHARKSRVGDCILARTTIPVEKDTLLRVGFGYSDYITIYLNKIPLFSGNSAYRSRDNSFLGIVGFFDILFLPLKKGNNELAVQVGESMGGWAFCFRNEDQTCLHPPVHKIFTLREGISLPEAALYDPIGKVCYISNYFHEGNEYLSKITPDGKILKAEWITGLRMPTGMCLRDHTLYVVDRTGLNVIDTRTGKIVEKIPLTGMRMPNDVAIDKEGSLYITDTPANALFRYANGILEPWLGSDVLDGPNGLLVDGDKLLVGMNGGALTMDIPTKKVSTLVSLETGSNVDGIQSDGKGNYLISDYNGKLFRIAPEGEKTLLINTSTPGDFIADFTYIPALKLLVIPTLSANSVTGYKINDE